MRGKKTGGSTEFQDQYLLKTTRHDDLPPPVNLDDGFASYRSATEVVAHTLRYTRTFIIKRPQRACRRGGKAQGFLSRDRER
ncbi:MAG TPA: hypothetical protein VKP66_00795 [Steroidobacteraceae bacterium]|nr:hypothetical protein [Steroidobacteraceae bacterium]